jgi:hypothetical protein
VKRKVWEAVDWIYLEHDKPQVKGSGIWVNCSNYLIEKMLKIFILADELLASQEILCSIQLVQLVVCIPTHFFPS